MNPTLFTVFGNCKNARRKAVPFKGAAMRPDFQFNFSDNGTFSRISNPEPFLARNFYNVPFEGAFGSLAQQAGRPLAPLETDLAWLAAAVYLTDRSAPRYPYGVNGPSFWRRRLHVVLPVSAPDVWDRTRPVLTETLEYLTEDDWTFEFIPDRQKFNEESQQRLHGLQGSKIAWTALFSGGLDSLVGTIHRLESEEGSGLLVSGQTHNRIASGQRSQVTQLRKYFPKRVDHVGIAYGVPDKSGLNGFESSQRTRAFIHTTLGSLAARMAGNEKLYLFENGFGALNLPCDSTQFGSQNSRGTHPVFLQRMGVFISTVFDHPFCIVNPFLFVTKAKMLSDPSIQRYSGMFKESFSCDRYPNYPHKAPQCGSCPSCLIRRLAFHGSRIPDEPTGYTRDLLSPNPLLRESELLAVTKLAIQATTLEETFRLQQPWPALCAIWPDLLRTEIELKIPSFKDSTIQLLRHHLKEWQAFCPEFQLPSHAVAA